MLMALSIVPLNIERDRDTMIHDCTRIGDKSIEPGDEATIDRARCRVIIQSIFHRETNLVDCLSRCALFRHRLASREHNLGSLHEPLLRT